MRILIISQLYDPEQFLINEIAPELVRRGHEVAVIAGVPNYPAGHIFPGYEKGKKKRERINGVSVIRCRNFPRGKTKVHLLLNYFSYMLLADREARRLDGQFDVVFLYQLTPVLQAWPAIRYARRNGKQLLCYCLDLAPASGQIVAKRFPPLFAAYTAFSRWAYQHCDHIAVTSRSFLSYLEETHGIPLTRMSYLPQHASEQLLHADLEKREQDGVSDFMFAGNLGTGARLGHVVAAAEALKHEGLRFRLHLVGNGSDKSRLVKMVSEKHLDDCVFFHDAVPMREMENVYRKADALIVTLRKGQVAVPGKVQAYMATGKPILGAMDGSGRDLIEEARCGRCVSAEDEDGLAALFRDFLQNSGAYADCGVNGRRYFREHFRFETYMDTLEALLNQACQTYN